MKKFLVLAMAATLLTAGSAFAVERHLGASLLPTPDLTFSSGQPTSTNNNDTCDIGTTPAATLLLPYFEVDTAAAAGTGATTLFTITNTSPYPQIAHVTVWTDWSFPVLDFNIFLTGYDVQGINLFDLIVRGIVVPGTPSGTSITTVPGTGSVAGAVPFSNTSNPNFVTSGGFNVSTTCANLPGTLPVELVTAVRSALTTGTNYNTGGVSCSGPIGFNHGAIAKGYVTIDVASYCSTQLPTDPGGAYFVGATASILFDNTLIGDYQQIGPTPAGSGTTASFDAQGNPLVHIRAIPEGGLSGASGGIPVATNLPFTFYDRYTPTGLRTADRRQPLPNQFAARYIQGGTAGFATDYKIWREGVTAGLPTCSSSGTVQLNSVIAIRNLVRFDEHENATGLGTSLICSPCAPSNVSLPETSRTSTTATLFPPLATTDLGGWMFLNLSSGSQHVTSAGLLCDPTLSAQRAGFAFSSCTTATPGNSGSRSTTQNWVVISMFGAVGANRLSVDFDAAWLGNGCTPEQLAGGIISPASQRGSAAQLDCPTNTAPTNCGVGTLPPPINP
jgi:hypothetical protein